jgi:hypothetical protein
MYLSKINKLSDIVSLKEQTFCYFRYAQIITGIYLLLMFKIVKILFLLVLIS